MEPLKRFVLNIDDEVSYVHRVIQRYSTFLKGHHQTGDSLNRFVDLLYTSFIATF